MAWNEPKDDKDEQENNGSDDKKPSSGSSNDPWNRPKKDSPPDLDEVFKDVKNKLSGLFGGKSSNNRQGGFGNGGNNNGNRSGGGFLQNGGGKGYLWLLLVPVVIWGASGFYTIEEGKSGVVLQFGRYVKTTNPGLHYHLPSPIQSVQVVDTQQVRFTEIGYRGGSGSRSQDVKSESLMLTEDENIVDVKLSVQYRVSDPKAYLFAVESPDQTLFNVVESMTREVVGRSTMDFVLTEGRSDIVNEIQSNGQAILDTYETGLMINDVNLQDAQPPEDVQAAFDDAIRAREDEQRSINQAEAYRSEIIPRSRGQAAAILEQARGYKERVVAAAEGESDRFSSLLVEFEKAPEVTGQRLYLETMEQVMGNTRKVIMGEDSGNLTMLPLQGLMDSVNQPTSNNSVRNPNSSGINNNASSAPLTTPSTASGVANSNNSNNNSNNNSASPSSSRTRER